MNHVYYNWTPIAIIGFQGGVSRQQEPRAHGGVCILEARRRKGKIQGRKINSNGRFREISEPFAMTESELQHWQTISQ